MYPPLAKLLHHRGLEESAVADLVIESPPRSGNSFAEAAVRIAFPGIKVVHHTHASGVVLWGLGRGIKCITLIRDPDEVAVSALLERPDIYDWKLAFEEWLCFYRPCETVKNQMHIVLFEQVTSDVIGFVNQVAAILGMTPAQDALAGTLPERTKEKVDQLARERVHIPYTNYSDAVPEVEATVRERERRALTEQLRDVNIEERLRARELHRRWIKPFDPGLSHVG